MGVTANSDLSSNIPLDSTPEVGGNEESLSKVLTSLDQTHPELPGVFWIPYCWNNVVFFLKFMNMGLSVIIFTTMCSMIVVLTILNVLEQVLIMVWGEKDGKVNKWMHA